jgi:hypothetical protein
LGGYGLERHSYRVDKKNGVDVRVQGGAPLLESAIATFSLVVLTRSVVVTSATLQAYEERMTAHGATFPTIGITGAHRRPTEAATTVKVSIFLTAFAAFSFTCLHIYLSR